MDASKPAAHSIHDEATAKPNVTNQEYADLKGGLQMDRQEEQTLTIRQAIRDHPALVWWSFYWSMAAVGWYVDSSFTNRQEDTNWTELGALMHR